MLDCKIDCKKHNFENSTKIFASDNLTLFRMGLFGVAQGWGWQKAPPFQNLSHISCNDETWHTYILPKEDPKNI